MTAEGQNADDFDFVVGAATGQQQPQQQQPQQQTPIQNHFNQNSVNGVVPGQEGQVAQQGVSNQQPVQQPVQPVQPVQQPVQQQPVAPVGQPANPVEPQTSPQGSTPVEPGPTEPKVEFNLDDEINSMLVEFGVDPLSKEESDNKEGSDDNKEGSDKTEVDNKAIAKDKKISIILEKLAAERDEIKDQLGNERYEKEQYKMAAEKLQNKLSEVIEQKTALEYDENKLQVNDQIKDLVHFYNKRTNDATQQTPDSVLTKRTLAEAVKVVEAITKVNMDTYLNQYYLASNPQIPKIGNNHYSPDQFNLDPNKPKERTIEEKKADPKRNPMEDRF